MAKSKMKPCNLLEIVTPKKIQLNGLWFGPARPKRAIIFVHGLCGSAFDVWLAEHLVTQETAVITFSNRGHDKVAKLHQLDKTPKGYHSVLVGEAHEVFAECVDDIQGVVDFVRKAGVKGIYLAGHSTGCQKSVYYASKKLDTTVKGLILLAPISDYAGAVKFDEGGTLAKATKVAQAMVSAGNEHELMPKNIWSEVIDAQRFLSLYTSNSSEEVFSYAQPKKNPTTLKKAKLPVLVFLAEKDEYGDRPAKEISDWFEKHCDPKKLETVIFPGASHGFKGFEKNVAGAVRSWVK